ncbi:hypothetical protein B0H11DRAFT_2015348 [Mycena galericulata]|nr:hypothetical protein B0H11DRAFT_2015348 [Mycena galericulata]
MMRNFLKSLLVNPSSLAPLPAQIPEPNVTGEDESAVPRNLRDLLAPHNITLSSLREVPFDLHLDREFDLFWFDVIRHLPANGADSTREEIWVAREKILASLLKSRQVVDGSAGPLTPVRLSLSTSNPEVTPGLNPASVPPIKTRASQLATTPPPIYAAGPAHQTVPRTFQPRASKVLPSLSAAKVEQARAEFEEPRGEKQPFSMQMILPPFYCEPDEGVEVGEDGIPQIRYDFKAIFVPDDKALQCAVVTAPEAPESRNIHATPTPHYAIRKTLARMEQRIDVGDSAPLEVDVQEEGVLVSVERHPDNIEDNWNGRILGNGPRAEGAHALARERDLEAISLAIDRVNAPDRLPPGVPYGLQAVFMPEAESDAAVLFVPDDPHIPGCETATWHLPGKKAQPIPVVEFERKVVDGEWEQLGRYKRKWMPADEEDGAGSPAKRRRPMGRDTVTRHLVLKGNTNPSSSDRSLFFLD